MTCDNNRMATARGHMIQLLEKHPWATPTTLGATHEFHTTLIAVRDQARPHHDHDRIAYLLPLRLDAFLAHWPQPPRNDHERARFTRDAKALCRHDIPRLRTLLMWAPAELPEQRTPRLGVPSLNTA